jgi:hypothetical protein
MLIKSGLAGNVPRIWSKFFMIFVTSTMLSLLGLNQNQIANAQQLQGLQNNQTSSSYTSKQQQHSGVAFDIDNLTFFHHTASVNGIQLHYVIGGHGPPIVLYMDGQKHGMDGIK